MTNQLLTVGQVSEILSLTPATVYKMIKQNELPFLRLGGQYRCPADELDAWISDKTFPAVK